MGSKTGYKDFSDTQLLDLLKTDDEVLAFTEIYDRYWPPLLLHANRMLQDQDLAKDVVQEIFTRLFQQSKTININTSLSAYLYSAVRNRVFDSIKHNKVKMNYAEDFFKYAQNVAALPDEQLALKELAIVIQSEIEKMPLKMREIFELSRKQSLSQKEIARMLNLSEKTVNNQIQRALKKLRKNDLLHSTSMLFLIYLTR